MCWSNATLFYGLWVTTASLDFAAPAYKATRPTILAIDLLVHRRRSGKLEIKGQDEKTTTRELPEEVWEMVKDELLGGAVEKAEQDRLSRFRCDWCVEQDYENSGVDGWCPCHSKGPEPVSKHAWNRWGSPPCDYGCFENVAESDVLRERTLQQLADINSLLKDHQLCLAGDQMWRRDGEDGYFDFDSLMAIALPLASTESGFPASRAEGHHEFGTANTVFNFTPEALIVPADANTRFRRLVSSYRLDVRDRTKGSALAPSNPRLSDASPLPPTTGSKEEKTADNSSNRQAEAKKETPKHFAKAEPRWMLWSLCEPCF